MLQIIDCIVLTHKDIVIFLNYDHSIVWLSVIFII